MNTPLSNLAETLTEVVSAVRTLTEIVSALQRTSTKKDISDRALILQRKANYCAHGNLCWHHFVFRSNARRCSQQNCTWRKRRVAAIRSQYQRPLNSTRVNERPVDRAVQNEPTRTIAACVGTDAPPLLNDQPTTSTANVWTQTPRIHRCTLATQTGRKHRLYDRETEICVFDRPYATETTATQTNVVIGAAPSTSGSATLPRTPILARPDDKPAPLKYGVAKSRQDYKGNAAKWPDPAELDALARPFRWRPRPRHPRYW